MKIRAEVLAVNTDGDNLNVRVQGKEPRAADWRPMLAFSMQVPDNARNRRAFYVGRIVRIGITV